MSEALGVIETIGWTAAFRAADLMVKSAYVELASIEKTGAGFVAVLVRGDVASVQAAVEIGAEEAAKQGELAAAHTISNPYPNNPLTDSLQLVRQAPTDGKAGAGNG